MFQTIMDAFAYGLAGLGIGGATGYYIAHRGLPGVQSDLLDIKNDILALKAKLGA